MRSVCTRGVAAPTFAAAVISLCALNGCDDNTSEESTILSATSISVPKEIETETEESSAVSNEISELSARELLELWKTAQQNHDFVTYESLYATRFDGIIEENNISTRFVREQWLYRQELAFQKGVSVTVQNEVVQVLPGMATIQLQLLENVDGHDEVVEKTILLAKEDGAVKIAREATYLRRRKPAKSRKIHKILKDFFLVLDNRYVVFGAAALEKKGALFVNDSTAIKPVRKEDLKKDFRRLMKQKFIVGYEDGSTEIVKITSTRAVARYGLHSGVRAYWVEQGYSEVEMGESLWEMASQSQSVYLTGVLQSSHKGALWATPVKPRVPEVYTSKALGAGEVKNIKKRMRKRDEYKILQQQFVDSGHSKKWIDYDSHVFARLFKSPKGNRKFAAATITAGKGCGDFFGTMQGFYHVQKGTLFDLGYPTDFFQDPFIDSRDVVQAIDIDHDGIPEFIGKNKLMYKIDDDWYVYEIRIPNADCPC